MVFVKRSCARCVAWALGLLVGLVRTAHPSESGDLWAHEGLIPWVVGVYDPQPLSPEQRGQMLEKLGFKKFAFFWEPDRRDLRAVDAEIEALQRHHIDIVAWWFSYDAQDPFAKKLLLEFQRFHIHPALWVSPTYRDLKTAWKAYVPKRLATRRSQLYFKTLPESDRGILMAAGEKAWNEYKSKTVASTSEDQLERIQQEVARIGAIVRLAAPYGNSVALYNHGGWSGIEDNQLAIIERLETSGIGKVGMVYAFNHVRDRYHDDTVDFPSLWARIKRHVVAITLTGVCMDDGSTAYPSQGDGELAMMRIIQNSGWRGQVALFAGEWHGRGDAETTLRNLLTGVDWLADELKRPGSGGPPPFPTIPLSNQPAK